MLRSYMRPRLAVSLRDMPRNDISFWADLGQREAPETEKPVAPQLAEVAAILKERGKGRVERELVAAASDPDGRNHRKLK